MHKSKNCPDCKEKLNIVDKQLQSWFLDHVLKLFPNAHVSCGYRGKENQNKTFDEGKTQLKFPYSKHNVLPARAIDIFLIDEHGKADWSTKWLHELDEYNRVNGINLRWGGTFSFKDYCHFEVSDEN